MTQNLRQVHALVLQAPILATKLRQAHLLTLSAKSNGLGIPAGKTAADALKTAILATASTVGKSLTASDFAMEDPVAITGTKNTRVKINATNVQLATGSQTLRYDRKGLSNASYLFTATIDYAGNTSVWALLAKINTLTGIVFETRDFEDTVIANGATEVTLVAGVNSYVFIPGTTLKIQLHDTVPVYPSLEDSITNSQMNGFVTAVPTLGEAIAVAQMNGFTAA